MPPLNVKSLLRERPPRMGFCLSLQLWREPAFVSWFTIMLFSQPLLKAVFHYVGGFQTECIRVTWSTWSVQITVSPSPEFLVSRSRWNPRPCIPTKSPGATAACSEKHVENQSSWLSLRKGLLPGSGRSPGEGNGSSILHSSILAWRIPWTEEPGGLQSMGSQRVNTIGRLTQQLDRPLKQQPSIWPRVIISWGACKRSRSSVHTLDQLHLDLSVGSVQWDLGHHHVQVCSGDSEVWSRLRILLSSLFSVNLNFLSPSADHSCPFKVNQVSPLPPPKFSALLFPHCKVSSHLIHLHGVMGEVWQDLHLWHLQTIFFESLFSVYLTGMMRKLLFLNTSYIQKQLLRIICSHGQKMVNVL